uniref:Uncharacterized protein n=1 Tax=Cacopsylla melanoneura TaxID=428564 RepID=A0A8D9B1H3_9HEMI
MLIIMMNFTTDPVLTITMEDMEDHTVMVMEVTTLEVTLLTVVVMSTLVVLTATIITINTLLKPYPFLVNIMFNRAKQHIKPWCCNNTLVTYQKINCPLFHKPLSILSFKGYLNYSPCQTHWTK